MNHTVFFFCALFTMAGSILSAQITPASDDAPVTTPHTDPLSTYAERITASDIEGHLRVLASDEFEGRETGTIGNDKAAAYIANHFETIGLQSPTSVEKPFFQSVAFTRTGWDTTGMTVNGKDFRHLWDFLSFPTLNPLSTEFADGEVVFAGYGIDDERYSDYAALDVEGKAVLIYQGEPFDKRGNSLVTGGRDTSEWSDDWRRKLVAAKARGAELVLIIEHRLQEIVSENRRFLVGSRMTMGYPDPNEIAVFPAHAFITTTLAEEVMGGQKKAVLKARKKLSKGKMPKQPVTLESGCSAVLSKYQRTLDGQNVLGYLPGRDPELRDELIVVTGHYDHLGMRGDDIFNGADDNGSGTSTVLDIAEAFAAARDQGQGPRRSILFMLVTGEEKGLLGSRYYVEHPVFPLEQTVANVNVDMIGRVDEAHADNPNYVYVIGADRLSTELHEINEAANARYTELELDYTFNAEDDPNQYYYRSDHYNFAERGIPAIFYFSGVHEDYHRPGDTADKIMYDKTATIGRLIFHTIRELANRDERIVVDVVDEGE